MNSPDEIKKGLEWDEVDESLRKIRFDDAGEVVEWKAKTSTDTKNGLLCCTIEGGCNDCPYQQDCFQTDGFSELAGDALALIQKLEAQVPRWISVEERLPDKQKCVLVFKQRNSHALWPIAKWHIEIDWRGEDGWSKNLDNGYFDITHWMPLPEPPKEE